MQCFFYADFPSVSLTFTHMCKVALHTIFFDSCLMLPHPVLLLNNLLLQRYIDHIYETLEGAK